MTETVVGKVVASAQVQAFDVGHSLDNVAKTSPQAEDLDFFNASGLEAWKERRVCSSQMEFGFYSSPYGLVVRSVSPRRAHLSNSSFAFNVQVVKDHRQDLRKEARDVDLHFCELLVSLAKFLLPARRACTKNAWEMFE